MLRMTPSPARLLLIASLCSACGSTSAPLDAARERAVDLAPAEARPADRATGDARPVDQRLTQPDAWVPPAVIDPSTLDRKVLFGYQGWFACPGDGWQLDAWVHWFRSQDPVATNATFDAWPDTSELGAEELCTTKLTLPSGQPAVLFSSHRPKTVARHFAWMKAAGIDGVFLQRFLSELADPAYLTLRDQVAANVRAGAEAEGRVFAVMYDLSGAKPASLAADLKADWAHLVDVLKVTSSPRYLRHAGKPVLGLWGLGFTDRPGTASEAQQLINWFRTGAPASQQVTLVGGVPTYWRTLKKDSRTDPAWASVYRSFDVVSPWAVGRYGDAAGADAFKQDLIVPDLVDLKTAGKLYMPVIFPGFSWHNLFPDKPVNQIPRQGGTFYWRQVANAVGAGVSMIYVAMFDELDEGTAMLKIVPSKSQLPAQGSFLSLDADGQTLPSDWYLRLGGATGRALRKEIPATAALPFSP